MQPDEIAAMANPLFRVPLELMNKQNGDQGTQFYHNLPIKNALQYATLGQFPQYDELSKIQQEAVGGANSGGGSSSSAIQNILKQFGLLKVSKNSTSSQVSQLMKEIDKNQAIKKKLISKVNNAG